VDRERDRLARVALVVGGREQDQLVRIRRRERSTWRQVTLTIDHLVPLAASGSHHTAQVIFEACGPV